MTELSPATFSENAETLDGNAAAGLLRQIFAFDATIARVVCGSCERGHAIAALKLYGLPMGAILRCPDCHAALIRVVARDPQYYFEMRGVQVLSTARD